ncbi:hypothetical protein NP493_244g02009 [Ridgeia piscesae]|uniref:Reverse transcriptase domain-containing protein n=1 Tax=Ridgeia piscesae TaxID=27915 RepID=A0AAD9NZ55_RIDPI|nr:hypothetical protein NP493_244g02009 [Ridgeia piscesae]
MDIAKLNHLIWQRVGLRLTAEQIFNLRILCEKYLQHQQDLYHVFIDFKKAFDRVWHAALWATMRQYNINANLIRMIQNLYDKATSAGYLNNNTGDWFRTTVGKLDCINSFKYLGAIIADERSKTEILARIAQTTAALAKLKTIWNDRNMALSSKIRLMRSLVRSIFLYACEFWTVRADTERRIQAMEIRCLRKLLSITYRDHISNEEVPNRTWQAIGPHEDLLTTVKRRKLKWYGHVTRSPGLAKTIL